MSINVEQVENENAKRYLQNLLENGRLEEVADDYPDLPSWYNEDLFKTGQQYFRRNIFASFVGMVCGLIAVLSIPTILSVLSCTNKSSKPLTAYRRYIRTIFYVVLWNTSELNSNKDERNSKLLKSIKEVHQKHTRSSRMCRNRNPNMFISQKDLVLTQFGFMGFLTLEHLKLGVNANPLPEYLEATVHFWRVVGHLLGIKDEYNLCKENWTQTKFKLEIIRDQIYKPNLSIMSLTNSNNNNDNNHSEMNVNEKFFPMVEALFSGLWSFNPFLSVDCYLFFTRRLATCEGYQYFQSDFTNVDDKSKEQIHRSSSFPLEYKKLSLYTRFRLFLIIILHQYICKISIFRWYFNGQMYLSLFLIYYFPFLAFPRFGFKQSYVRILKTK